MSNNAIIGMGTIFYRWDGVSSWVALAEVSAINGPNITRDTVETTDFNSDWWRTFIAGLRDGGEIALTLNFTRAGYTILRADFVDNDLQNYKILLPDDDETAFEVEGLITDIALDVPLDDKITSDTSIKVSGEPVMYDNSSGS
jgi:predicted secreted protein